MPKSIAVNYTSTTSSRLISSRPTHFRGYSLYSTTSKSTIAFVDSGVSIASLSIVNVGATAVCGGYQVIAPSDTPHHVSLPEPGIKMNDGLWVYLPQVGGATLAVYYS